MHRDEVELETAGEEPEHQEHIAAVAEGLGEGLRNRLLGLARPLRARQRARGERDRQRQDEQDAHREDDQGRMPAEGFDQGAADGREQELAERAGGGAGAEGEGPPALRQELAEGADHQVERAAGEAEADQHPGAQMEHSGRRGVGHDDEAERVEEGARAQDAGGAEAVGDGAREGLADAPQEVLEGDGEPEDVASPAELGRHRHLEQTGRGARPEADQRDQATGEDDELGRDPGPGGQCGHLKAPA
jgi:hypothetical protein